MIGLGGAGASTIGGKVGDTGPKGLEGGAPGYMKNKQVNMRITA